MIKKERKKERKGNSVYGLIIQSLFWGFGLGFFIRMSKGLDRSVKGEIHGGARRWEGERGARGGARGYLYIIIYIYMFIYLTYIFPNLS